MAQFDGEWPVFFCITLLALGVRFLNADLQAKTSYFMNDDNHCGYSGYLLMNEGDVVNVFSRHPSSTTSSILSCRMTFRPKDERDIMDVSFTDFSINDKDVTLKVELTGASVTSQTYLTMLDTCFQDRIFYTCDIQTFLLEVGSEQPKSMISVGGQVTVTLRRSYLDDNAYYFGIILQVYRADDTGTAFDESPQAVGLIVGIAIGIVGFLIFLCTFTVCCYRQKRNHLSKHPLHVTDYMPPDGGKQPASVSDDGAEGNGLPGRGWKAGYVDEASCMTRNLIGRSGPDRSESDSDAKEADNGKSSRSVDCEVLTEECEYSNIRTTVRRGDKSHGWDHRSISEAGHSGQIESCVVDVRGGHSGRPIKANPLFKPTLLSSLLQNGQLRVSRQANAGSIVEKMAPVVPSNESDGSVSMTWNTTFDTNFDDDPRPPKATIIKPKMLPTIPMSPHLPALRADSSKLADGVRNWHNLSPVQSVGEVAQSDARKEIQLDRLLNVAESSNVRHNDDISSSNTQRKGDRHRAARAQYTSRPGLTQPETAAADRHGATPTDGKTHHIPTRALAGTGTANRKTGKRSEGNAAPRAAGENDVISGTGEASAGGEGRFRKADSARRSKSKRTGRSHSVGSALADEVTAGGRTTASSDGEQIVPEVTADDYEDSDVESGYNQLRRSGSKGSLYASRSSLYGRRRSKNSCGESLHSFVQDDTEYERGNRDGLRGRRLSHRDRAFKSLGDLEAGYNVNRSTQAIQNCASQTGKGSTRASSRMKTSGAKHGQRESKRSSFSASRKEFFFDDSSFSSGAERSRSRKDSLSSSDRQSVLKSQNRKRSSLSALEQPKRAKSARELTTLGRQQKADTKSISGTVKNKQIRKTKLKKHDTAHLADDDSASIRTRSTGPLEQSSAVSVPPAIIILPHPAYPIQPGYVDAGNVLPITILPSIAVPLTRLPAMSSDIGNDPPVIVSQSSKWETLCRLTNDISASDVGPSSASEGNPHRRQGDPHSGQGDPHRNQSMMSVYGGDNAVVEPVKLANSISGNPRKSSWATLREITDYQQGANNSSSPESNV